MAVAPDNGHDSRADGKQHRFRTGLGVALQVLLAISLVAGINVLASRNPMPGLRGDWTQDSRNTLHPDSAAMFESLTDNVELILFYSPLSAQYAAPRAQVEDVFLKTDLMIREASYLSPRVRVESLNPATNPDRAAAALQRTSFDERQAVGNFLLVNARGRTIKLSFSQLAVVDRKTGLLAYGGEDAIYRAVVEVTRREERMVTFAQGAGELDPVREQEALVFASLLDREAYRIGRVNLAKGESIRPETNVLVLARPLQDYDERTISRIGEYHRKGGNLLLMIGAGTPAENIRRYLRSAFQLEIGGDDEVLYDPGSMVRQYPDWILLDKNFGTGHSITRPLANAEQKIQLLLPRVRPLRLKAPNVCDYLLTSNPGAWPDRRKPGNYARQMDEDEKVPGADIEGFPIAVAVNPARGGEQDTTGTGAGRVVLVCSGEICTSQLLSGRTANGPFLVNAVHWLAGKDASERIAPVAVDHPRLALSAKDDRLLFWLVAVLPAAVMMILGFLVFFTRRG